MKFLALFILLPFAFTTANGQSHYAFWISAGYGGSSYGQGESHWSKSGNVGLGVGYTDWRLKYTRRVSSQFAFASSENQSKSHELILAHSLTPDTQFAHLALGVGIGQMKQTASSSERSLACGIVEFEYRFQPISIASLSIAPFAQFGSITPIFGAQLNLLLGYW